MKINYFIAWPKLTITYSTQKQCKQMRWVTKHMFSGWRSKGRGSDLLRRSCHQRNESQKIHSQQTGGRKSCPIHKETPDCQSKWPQPRRNSACWKKCIQKFELSLQHKKIKGTSRLNKRKVGPSSIAPKRT